MTLKSPATNAFDVSSLRRLILASDDPTRLLRIREFRHALGLGIIEEHDLQIDGVFMIPEADACIVICAKFGSKPQSMLRTLPASMTRVLITPDQTALGGDGLFDAVAPVVTDLNAFTFLLRSATGASQCRVGRIDADRRLLEERYLNSALTRTILHDLKNPLTVTVGSIQLVRSFSREQLTERQEKLLSGAEDSCRAELAIIRNLGDLLKLEAGALTYRLYELDPIAILARQVAEVAQLDASKHYTFTPPNSPVRLSSDNEAFQRIVRNILENCMRHTQNGGSIEVTAEVDPASSEFVVVIHDTGEPVPDAFRDGIFLLRNQSIPDHPGRRGDVGMGLAYARAAARALRGDLVLLTCDDGAIFRLALPAIIN